METKNTAKVKEICQKYNVEIMEIGKTTKNSKLKTQNLDKIIIDLSIEEMAEKWLNGLRDKLNS